MHAWSHMHACTVHAYMCASHTREMTPKLDFNTKILLTSRIMHRFQRFLVFWKAECSLFHLETTFLHCVVFVYSKTSFLKKKHLLFWTNAGSSIPDRGCKFKMSHRNTHNYAIRPECSKNSVHELVAVQSTAPTDQNSQSMVWRKMICRNKTTYSGGVRR